MLSSSPCPGPTVPHAATSSATGSPHATSFMPAPLLHSLDQAYSRSKKLRQLERHVQNPESSGAVTPRGVRLGPSAPTDGGTNVETDRRRNAAGCECCALLAHLQRGLR